MRAGITLEKVGGILYYGRRVQVVEPACLGARVAEEHRRAAGICGWAISESTR